MLNLISKTINADEKEEKGNDVSWSLLVDLYKALYEIITILQVHTIVNSAWHTLLCNRENRLSLVTRFPCIYICIASYTQ